MLVGPVSGFAGEAIFFTAAESPQEIFDGTAQPKTEADDEPLPLEDDGITPPMVMPAPAPPPPKPAPPAFPGPKTLPPTGPWKILFFENDFSYALQPDHEHLFGEELKFLRSDLYDNTFTLATGGEIRHRYMNEDNRLRPGGPVHTDYNLWRWRQYIDAHWCDFRVYAELIDADSFGSTAPDQAIDVNRWELLNLFADWTFLRDDLGAHTVRVGRQELLFGRQRLVSPLDWGNTRRNFQGVRYMLKGDDYRLDVFATHPVNSATGFQPVAIYDSRFDQPNYHVWFSGAYFTYTGMKDTVVDAYWLYLDTGTTQNPAQPDGMRHLLGSRFARLIPVADGARVWDVDTEGGFQLGRDNGESVLAGFYTYIIGHTWKSFYFTPRLSHTFYYGSGDQIANSGHNNTFNTLFPLGHAYWAISDNLSGQNLYDYAIQTDVKPTKKTALTSAFHWFSLASNGDRLYNVAGVPVGTPGNGRDVGTALDIYGYYSYNANLDIQAGYSWFWYGSYVEAVAPRGDATQFYVQTSFRY
jgi:hypothetical protein